jgi:signal transduction histidine kinase
LAPALQFPSLLNAAKSFASPIPFENSHDEALFRRAYVESGYGFAVAGTLLGTLACLGFMLIAYLNPQIGGHSFFLQMLRALIAVSAGLSCCFLILDPVRALRNYHLTIFMPVFVALFGMGVVLFLPRPDEIASALMARSTLSFLLAVWLVSAFCRLPITLIMALTIGSSLLHLIGLAIQGAANLPFMILDLVIANCIVWVLGVQIEKRERIIWHQDNRTRNAMRVAKTSAHQANVATEAHARLMRSVGHDIRQPLSSSGIYLGVVSRNAERAANENLEENIEKVRTCMRSIEDTLERLMEVPGANSSPFLDTQRTDLSEVFSDLRDVFAPQAKQLGVTLHFTGAWEQSSIVRTNVRAMREVLSNLVANGLKYSSIVAERSPKVVVGVTQIGNNIRVDIIDNGIGIPNELHTKVFDEYYRSPSVTEQVQGTGLGLAIVESTVQRLPDHRLRLKSQESLGTRVKVYLPAA